jgi:pimeloyl-ACP methyl ester carboxylesterase
MIIYLHGFASTPLSRKAQVFERGFREQGTRIEVPDLAEGDFEHLTITGQLRVVERVAAGRPVSLIGSSMGGYLAALYASRHPEVKSLVLLAPAFYFPQTWSETLGPERVAEWKRTRRAMTFHYGEQREVPLDYRIVEDSAQYPPAPDFRQPALLFHGTKDTVVRAEHSVEYARTHPNVTLRLVDSGHELTDVIEEIWDEASRFLSEDRSIGFVL